MVINKKGYCIEINLKLFQREAIIETLHEFTEQFYVNIQNISESIVKITFQPKDSSSIEKIEKEFYQKLIEHQLRSDLDVKMDKIREMIVRKAFFPFDKK